MYARAVEQADDLAAQLPSLGDLIAIDHLHYEPLREMDATRTIRAATTEAGSKRA